MFVQGVHKPVSLIQKTGVWIQAAGNALFTNDCYRFPVCENVVWLVVEEKSLTLQIGEENIFLEKGESVVIPANTEGAEIKGATNARLLWLSFAGPLHRHYLAKMNALNSVPARQGILPSQIVLISQIVQVLVRHSDTGGASYQLEQLLWGLIAAHCGQSVSTQATLSHEISRVVDAMRACRFKENFSLTEMASISRMPLETFRKRFTTELGIPPLGYLQFLKIERAKHLLRSGLRVRQTGIEIGISDPYHFSKQFKHIVGMSPTAYLKHVRAKDDALLFPLSE